MKQNVSGQRSRIQRDTIFIAPSDDHDKLWRRRQRTPGAGDQPELLPFNLAGVPKISRSRHSMFNGLVPRAPDGARRRRIDVADPGALARKDRAQDAKFWDRVTKERSRSIEGRFAGWMSSGISLGDA